MDTTAPLVDQDSKNKKRARIIAAIFAVLLFFLILYPFWSYTFPPPEQSGILVSFGEVEIGGNDSEESSQQEQVVETPAEAQKDKQQSEIFQKNDPSEEASKTKKAEIKTKSATQLESPVTVKEKVVKSISEPSKQPSKEELAKQKAADEAKKLSSSKLKSNSETYSQKVKGTILQ